MRGQIFSLKTSLIILGAALLSACGGGSSTPEPEPTPEPLSISAEGFKGDVKSYEPLEVTFTGNYDCGFTLSGDHIYWVNTTDNKTFTYRAPVVLKNNVDHTITVTSIGSSACPNGSRTLTHSVSKDEDILKFNPTTRPYNLDALSTNYFASHNLGFGGISITERYTATICYPTPEDCTTFENQLFGQDAHNMATGDFNGDGHEDMVVAWAIFPHTIEEDQKVYAPLQIYLNDGQGDLYEDLNVYFSGEPTTHPFAYRLVVNDFNGDGIDDIFAGSMGLQYRDSDAANDYIGPYPDLLMLSDENGKFTDASANIDDQNQGQGKLCGFSHDASGGDFDNDGDIDIFACNILLVNDGTGNFSFHSELKMSLQHAYGNPMSSLVADLNNDGYADLIFWNFDNRFNFENVPEEGFVLLSDGTASIMNWSYIELPPGPFGVNHNKYNHAAAGDLNNDGNLDVVVAITRDLPYYEGAYVQVLLGNGEGNLTDVTNTNFAYQPRDEIHHGEGNIYLRDFDNDGDLDIYHSTRHFGGDLHGAHLAINNGSAVFESIPESWLPEKPRSTQYDTNFYTFKGLPIDLDGHGCLDMISTSDSWSDNGATRNYLYSLMSIDCN